MRQTWSRPVSLLMIYFNKNAFRFGVVALVLAWLAACGGGGSGSPTATVSLPGVPVLNALPLVPAVKNQLAIYVDGGPKDTGYNVNRLYTQVTICHPGKSLAGSPTQCQTIDHVLVDTGSTGLRLLSSVMAPALDLSRVTGSSGLPLLNCAQFVDDTFAWGSVALADIVLAGMPPAQVPIQVIADPAFDKLSAACSASGTAITTASRLGANGVIGLGLFKEDCGDGCIDVVRNGFYYTCTSASCINTVGSSAMLEQQVKNPVPLFASDGIVSYNNGVLVNLPAVISPGMPSVKGALFFGIGTPGGTVSALATSASGYFSTTLASRSMNNSFIDSGSNGLYFDSSSIPACVGLNVTGFYCPTSPYVGSATLVGINNAPKSVSFTLENALTLFDGGVNHVLPTLGGNFGHTTSFDWGLPFFYGRPVYVGIEGQTSTLGTGPFYAF